MHRAFTMVEIIVVIVLISVLAGLVLPRLFNAADKQVGQEARACGLLLSALAQRDATSNEPLALDFNGQTQQLTLMVLMAKNEGDTPTWQPAPLSERVSLGVSRITQVTTDSRPVPGATADGTGSWRIEVPATDARPPITLVLTREGSDKGPAFQVDLATGEVTARLRELPSPGATLSSDAQSQDLDRQGSREVAW
jgi:prepilin-type N-terminal cleavage/methylation domain-containing protein